jgi:hypothetical protein
MRRGTYRISTGESGHREANVMSTDTCGQLFGGRRRLRLVPLATALVLAAAAPAGAAVPTINRLIPPQYQATSGDTATTAGVAVLAGLTAHRAGPPGGSTTWYRTRNARYQLQNASIQPSAQLARYMVNLGRATSTSVPRHNRLQIAQQIRRSDAVSHEPQAISSGDARLLLRLGLGLALTYIVFLAAWFWRTRNRTEGASARVVRF